MAGTTDLLIIGGGCAGLTAAIYAIRSGLPATVLESGFSGGQIAVTNEIENYPGYVKISGPDLAMKIYEQAQRLGADIQMEQVVKASLASPVKTLQTNGGEYKGKSVIIANGVKRRTLDCPGEKELTGKGVSYCATCDGAFFRGKGVAVIGGGNTALEDALFLSNLCESVFLIHRRNAFRGEKLFAEAVEKRKNIIFHGETVVKEILGEKSVTAAVIRSINSRQNQPCRRIRRRRYPSESPSANSYRGVRRGYRRLPGRKLCEHSGNRSPLILNRQPFPANGFGG